MNRNYDSLEMLERLQKETNLAVDEMKENQITKVDYFSGHVPKYKDSKTYVYATVFPEQFPYNLTVSCGGTGTRIGRGYHLDYGVTSQLQHASIGTKLFNNERDKLLLTPENIRERGIKDFEEDIKIASRYVDNGFNEGAINNIRKSLKKLKTSLKGKTPKIEIYEYVPEDKMSDSEYKRHRSPEREITIEYLGEVFNYYIDIAKQRVVEHNISKSKTMSVDYYGGEISPVSLHTTSNNFPFGLATGIGGHAIAPWGIDEIGVKAWLGDIHIFTDVPFSKRKIFLGLRKELRKQLLGQYEIEDKWFQKLSEEKKEELFNTYPKARQTRKFISDLTKSIS